MELAQTRIVTDDVARLAGFYASLLGMPVALNDGSPNWEWSG
jgi:hypothetical protein